MALFDNFFSKFRKEYEFEEPEVPNLPKSEEASDTPEAPMEERPQILPKKTCYTNRELSWLSFNMRVLNEAANPRVPLAERLTFASIYQTNLDEFFMVRVGTLMTQMNSKETICENKTGMTSSEQVDAILEQVKTQELEKSRIYEQLLGELEPQGIRIINFQKLSEEEGALLETYFDNHIVPFLSPMIIGKQTPFPFLNNKDLYCVVKLTTKKGKEHLGIVPCKNMVFRRLIEIPTRPGNFMLSEELILHFIGKLYSRYTVTEKSVLRITRNADIDAIEIYDEDLDYRGAMEQIIKKRKRLAPVRAELTRPLDKKTIKELASYLQIDKKYFIQMGTPLDLRFVFEIQKRLESKPELFYNKRTPRYSKDIALGQSIFEQIEKKDVLLSYPYHSMKPFISMLEEAARDPKVLSIKMTLYRVAEGNSKIIDALTEAAENGKEVIVMVELRARFDEENNIDVSRQLQNAGCQIIYGLEKYKCHSKLTLITKMTDDHGSFFYTQVGTGNYNEKTAKLYTDYSLLTANQEIGREVAHVFSDLQKGEVVNETQHLLVAPECMQNKILEMMDAQIALAKAGRPNAYIGAKINSLTDKKLIEKIIEASQAGVQVDLIVRGICCLRPKVPGYTENVTVISIVGRFLEHSRIYIFGREDSSKVYISSADFMTRNTVRRVEVATPILDPVVKTQILEMFRTELLDDEKGKEQDAEAIYHDRHLSDTPLNSQEMFYQRAYDEDPTLLHEETAIVIAPGMTVGMPANGRDTTTQ